MTADGLSWRKSSFSGNENCVEVAELPDGGTAIRNSKAPGDAVVEYTRDEWNAFVCGVKAGEFDPA